MAALMMPPVTVEMALGYNPLDAAPSWIDVTNKTTPGAGLLTCRTTRGRQHELSQMQAGTAVLRYRNVNDWWSPWNTASPYYGNLLSADQADAEGSITGWVVNTNCTISRSTTLALHGTASLLLTSTTASGTMQAQTTTGTGGIVVYGSKQYTALASFRGGSGTSRPARMKITWFDSGGSVISTVAGNDSTVNPTTFTLVTYTGTSPANAAYASVIVSVDVGGVGELWNVDQISLHAGSSSAWFAGGQGGLLQPMTKMRVSSQLNLLTAIQSNLEAASPTGWSTLVNSTIATTTGQFYEGTRSMEITATAGGTIQVATSGAKSQGVVAGQSYVAIATFRAGTTGRTMELYIRWFDAGGAFLSQDSTSVVDTSVGWSQVSKTAVAPAGATQADVLIQGLSWGAGEKHYVDAVGIMVPGITSWSVGGTYYVLTGYVQEIKQMWPDPTNAEVEITVVDGFKVLNLSQIISTAYRDAVLVDTPMGYYGLNEAGTASVVNGLITLKDSSGNSRDGTFKGSPAGYGKTGALPAEIGSAVDFGIRQGWGEAPSTACPSGTGDWSVEAWVYPRSFQQATPKDAIWNVTNVGTQTLALRVLSDGTLNFTAQASSNGGSLASTTALTLNRWNHVVAAKIGTTGPASWKLYINGVDVSGTPTLAGTGNVSLTANSALLGGFEGFVTPGVGQGALDGLLDEVAIYPAALTITRVTAHYNAAYGLAANSLAGARVGNLLDLIGWPAGDRSLAAGQFQLQGVTTSLYTTTSLSYILQAVESEGYPAAFFMNGQGFAVLQDRANSTPASSGTFGDNAGEMHYNLDSQSVPVRDDLDIWTTVVCQATGGVAQTVFDATAQARYGKRTLSKTGLLNASDADVLTLATASLARYKDPHDRVRAVRLQPNTDPGNLFAAVLGAEVGTRYTVNRHKTLGSGAPLSLDTRCEGIAHDIDFTTGNWFTTLMLIPT